MYKDISQKIMSFDGQCYRRHFSLPRLRWYLLGLAEAGQSWMQLVGTGWNWLQPASCMGAL